MVLCRAEGSANVGAVCRAMKGMGLSRLILANCGPLAPDTVRTYALSAYDLYEAAQSAPSLDEALKPFGLVAGFSRRSGRKRKEPVGLRDFARGIARDPGRAESLALVFGNERDGLSDAELGLCDLCVSIPADPAFPSLNLSHAVQLAAWELRQARLELSGDAVSRQAAMRVDYEASARRIAERLAKAGFFKLTGQADAERFLRELEARASLSVDESQRLERLFSKLAALDRE